MTTIPDWRPQPDLLRLKWRGKANMILAQHGPTADDNDPLIAYADTDELAGHIVALHNTWVDLKRRIVP